MTIKTKITASLLAFSLLAATPALAQEDPLRIAVVNMDLVVNQSAAGSALNEKLQAFQQETQEQVKVQQERIEDMRKKVSEAVDGDQAQLVNLQKQFEDATVALRRFTEEKQREAQKIRAEGLLEIQEQFDPVFTALQEEFNYDLILNQQTGVVLLVGDRVNITDMVIERLK